MQVHYNFDKLKSIRNPILTIGTYDGVHVGHQKIIKRLNEEAKKLNGESVLFTFSPHPRIVLNPGSESLKMIQTEEEKIRKLAKTGLDHLLIYPFTKEFSNTSAEEFIKNFLVETLNVHTIVVGYDHQFGKNREGSLEHLLKLATIFPFHVIEIPAQEIDEVNISSTKIRSAILEGDVEIAEEYLNEAFELSGLVVRGAQLGRTIGFPTANIEVIDKHKIIPKFGVYAVEVELENSNIFHGMMNIGVKPTVSSEQKVSLEVSIFDFDEDIYGQRISVRLLKRIREEKKFSSLEELKQQIANDKEAISLFFITN
jgi:riboflavin kinase/FMN adenylyltransferase